MSHRKCALRATTMLALEMVTINLDYIFDLARYKHARDLLQLEGVTLRHIKIMTKWPHAEGLRLV